MNKRGFQSGFGRSSGSYRQSYQQKRQYDDYDSDQELRRESRGRKKPQYRNMSGGTSFTDDPDFPVSPRRDALDSGFNSLSRLSGSNPSAYRSGSSQLVDRGLDSSDSLMGLGSSVGNSDFIGARASTQWLEEQLRMRETQLAMTSSLLKEQTHLLSQVGSVLERRSAPLKRELPPAPQNQPYDFPKRFRSNYRSGGSERSRQYEFSTSRSRGWRGGMRGRGNFVINRGGKMLGLGVDRRTDYSSRQQKQKPMVQTSPAHASQTAAKVEAKKRTSTKRHKPDYLKPEDIPEHDSSKAVGDRYIVSVKGYYCKLCNKFYQKEHSARVLHASQQAHYDKWKATILQSIKDRNRNASGTNTSEKPAKETNGTKEKDAPVEESMEVKTSPESDDDEIEGMATENTAEMTEDTTEIPTENAADISTENAAEISTETKAELLNEDALESSTVKTAEHSAETQI